MAHQELKACQKCGYLSPPDSRFCAHCGEPLDAGSPEPEAPGVAWDQRRELGLLAAAYETARDLLTSPTDFFGRMRSAEKHSAALLYCALFGLLGGLLSSIWMLLMASESLDMLLRQSLGRMLDSGQLASVRQLVIVLSVLLAPLMTIVNVYLWSAVIHMVLNMFGYRQHRFTDTLYIVAFSQTALLAHAIPILGNLLVVVGSILFIALGLHQHYRVSGTRAAIAVLAAPFLMMIISIMVGLMLAALAAGVR